MEQKFEELLKNFKPEFGNEQHLQVLEMITKLRKKEHHVKDLLKNQSAIKRTLKEITKIEKDIMFMMKEK